jgi:hypothetical protein
MHAQQAWARQIILVCERGDITWLKHPLG